MKRILTAASLALAAALALASPAEAAPTPPGDTPALACGLGTVDLTNPPIGYPVATINDVARKLGLAEVPTAVGLGCDRSIPTDPYSGTHPYPGSGPVVLRSSERAPTQEYCTDSVSALGDIIGNGGPVPGGKTLAVIGSGCVVEANPIVI
ncbi:hypothetical protein [Streptomyces sp. F-1]|uniref:hypothetical protein n=1 Tax=Streptomyces sp. F-1 TaxID=463642 RepID=UPI00085CD085|nr:hypothetical protein [Streptomyces sp. F-1]SFY48339.1 hypothetical protein STEPF1_01563 [Streptomyces sp. F-1]